MSRTIGFDQAFTIVEGTAWTFRGAGRQARRAFQRRQTNEGAWSTDVKRSDNRFIRRWHWRVAQSSF